MCAAKFLSTGTHRLPNDFEITSMSRYKPTSLFFGFPSLLCVCAATLALLGGCSAIAPISPAASRVRVTNNEPPQTCTFLGDVTGSQGDLLRGAITSNADLETGARNDLKNKAAAMGGNVVYLLTQRSAQTGGRDHLEQTNVTLSGNVYRCGDAQNAAASAR